MNKTLIAKNLIKQLLAMKNDDNAGKFEKLIEDLQFNQELKNYVIELTDNKEWLHVHN